MSAWRKRALASCCVVCGGVKRLEVAHLVARSELPKPHPFYKDPRNLTTLCRWCHLALDLALEVTFPRYHPHQPLDRLRTWFRDKRAAYIPLLQQRNRLLVELYGL